MDLCHFELTLLLCIYVTLSLHPDLLHCTPRLDVQNLSAFFLLYAYNDFFNFMILPIFLSFTQFLFMIGTPNATQFFTKHTNVGTVCLCGHCLPMWTMYIYVVSLYAYVGTVCKCGHCSSLYQLYNNLIKVFHATL